MTIGTGDPFPFGRMDFIVFVLRILLAPGHSAHKPITQIEIKGRRHNSCHSVDVREQGKETTVEEQFRAESECTEGGARTVKPVARVPKEVRREESTGTRRANNYNEGFLCGRKYVVVVVGNFRLGID